MATGDANLIQLVARAGRAFRACEGLDPVVEGAALAEWLRSGAEIGAVERELLAELVTGEWRRPQGAPKRKGAGHQDAIAIVQYYLQALNNSRGPKDAKHETANSFGISERTVERYLEEGDARNRSQDDAKAALDKK